MAEPVYPWFITGDGAFARLKWKRPGYTSESGLPMTLVRIVTNQWFMHKYGITRSEVRMDADGDEVLEKKFPDVMLKTLSDDPVTGVVLLYCDWYGRETPLMELKIMKKCSKCGHIEPSDDIIGLKLLREKSLLREIYTLNARNIRLQKDLHNLSVHQEKFDKAQTDRIARMSIREPKEEESK